MRARLRRRYRWWIPACVGLMLVGTELSLRMVGFGDPPLVIRDPEIEYYSKPGTYRQFHSTIDVNAWGMRGSEVQEPKTQPRLLLIGDSIVSGTFRLDQDELISVTLQQELGKRLGAQRDENSDVVSRPSSKPDELELSVEVLNVAANSWGPVNQLAYLSRMGVFAADAAVWVLSSHDLTDVPVPGAAELLPTEPFLLATQDLVNVVHRRLTQEDASGPGVAVQSLAAVDGLIDLLRKHDLPFFVAVHWSKQELDAGELAPHGQRLLTHLSARGVQAVSLASALEQTQEAYADTIHLTPAGARAIGEHLAPLAHRLMAQH